MTEERPMAAPSERPERSDGPSERPSKPQRRFTGRKKICRLCNKVRCSPGEAQIDYKDVGRLRMLISERGKIEPRRKTGSCALGQRALSTAIKRARHVALLPYTLEHVRKTRIFPTRG
jgi:small subunit ribosomal protein S18